MSPFSTDNLPLVRIRAGAYRMGYGVDLRRERIAIHRIGHRS